MLSSDVEHYISVMHLLFRHPVSSPSENRSRIPAFPLLSPPSQAGRATQPFHTTGFVPGFTSGCLLPTDVRVFLFHSVGAFVQKDTSEILARSKSSFQRPSLTHTR